MILQKRKITTNDHYNKDTRDGILTYCKINHPNEGILILRGKSKKEMLQ